MELWHGGRDLEFNYKKHKPSKKGRWEGGPGLYLTTHYETARKYSKGGGKTYKVDFDFDLSKSQSNVNISLEKIIDFVGAYVIGKHKKPIINDIHNHCKRINNFTDLKSEILVNLCVNYDALSPKNTLELNRFLVDNGVDFGLMENFSGRSETVVVLYNLALIHSVKPVPSSNVKIEEFELNNQFENKKLRICNL